MCSWCRPRRTQVGSYSKCRSDGGPWCSSDRRMSRMRWRMRANAHPALDPRQRATGTGVHPPPEGQMDLCVGPVEAELRRAFEQPGSRLAAPLSNMTGVPASMSTPPTVVERRARRKSDFTGLSMRSDLFDEAGDPLVVRPQLVLEFGVLAEVLEADGEQPGRRLLAGREQERGGPDDRGHLGRGAVGVGAQGQIGECIACGARADGPRCTGRTSHRARPVRSRPDCPPRRLRLRPGYQLRPKHSRKRWWSSSGTPSTSATASMAKGWV